MGRGHCSGVQCARAVGRGSDCCFVNGGAIEFQDREFEAGGVANRGVVAEGTEIPGSVVFEGERVGEVGIGGGV